MEILRDTIKDLNSKENIYTYTNHHLIRFFRCYLDGSYKGYDHYVDNCEKARQMGAKEMRSHLMSEFIDYLKVDNYSFELYEVELLFLDEKFYNEIKEAIYNLVES